MSSVELDHITIRFGDFVAVGGICKARNGAKNGCLPATRGAEKAKELARVDGQIAIVDGDEVTKPNGNMIELNAAHLSPS
jgi:hypothetical protein